MPDHPVSVIRRLHHGALIKLAAGKEERITPCSVGVKQRDSWLEKKSGRATKLTCLNSATLRRQNMADSWDEPGRRKVRFSNCTNMVRASRIIHGTMTRFALIMRVERDGKLSKNKAMCHPLCPSKSAKAGWMTLMRRRRRALQLMAVSPSQGSSITCDHG